jgi:hypothetical protein
MSLAIIINHILQNRRVSLPVKGSPMGVPAALFLSTPDAIML